MMSICVPIFIASVVCCRWCTCSYMISLKFYLVYIYRIAIKRLINILICTILEYYMHCNEVVSGSTIYTKWNLTFYAQEVGSKVVQSKFITPPWYNIFKHHGLPLWTHENHVLSSTPNIKESLSIFIGSKVWLPEAGKFMT